MFEDKFLIEVPSMHILETFSKPSFSFYENPSHFFLSFQRKSRNFWIKISA